MEWKQRILGYVYFVLITLGVMSTWCLLMPYFFFMPFLVVQHTNRTSLETCKKYILLSTPLLLVDAVCTNVLACRRWYVKEMGKQLIRFFAALIQYVCGTKLFLYSSDPRILEDKDGKIATVYSIQTYIEDVIYFSTHTHTHTYIHIYKHTHTHTHTHTHIHIHTYKNYADTTVQYGFTLLFIPALPCATALSLLNNYAKLKFEAWKQFELYQRPIPVACQVKKTLYHTIPHHTTPYHNIPHHTTLYHTITHYNTLNHTITHYNTLYHTIPHYTILYHTIPHYTTLYHTITHHTTL